MYKASSKLILDLSLTLLSLVQVQDFHILSTYLYL